MLQPMRKIIKKVAQSSGRSIDENNPMELLAVQLPKFTTGLLMNFQTHSDKVRLHIPEMEAMIFFTTLITVVGEKTMGIMALILP